LPEKLGLTARSEPPRLTFQYKSTGHELMKAPHDAALTLNESGPLKQSDKAKMMVDRAPAAKREQYLFLAVMALALATFFFGLGRLALIGPDEPRYAEVAREMYATGDYISTRLCGCLWFEKPALLYWMAAASYHLLGVSELAARLPSAIAAISTVAFIFFTLRRVASFKAAIAASTVRALQRLIWRLRLQ
jgi:predicted membrane-bound mannosyltransferase